ncbi:hypothetical protein B0H13DRAFT_2530901 [Mycena leptocephala]|nr:hypothetical protein B0H13DRAFT_2530901 [Mycena leptocephala]
MFAHMRTSASTLVVHLHHILDDPCLALTAVVAAPVHCILCASTLRGRVRSHIRSASTRRMRVIATHSKHAKTPKIEWCSCTRAPTRRLSSIVHLPDWCSSHTIGLSLVLPTQTRVPPALRKATPDRLPSLLDTRVSIQIPRTRSRGLEGEDGCSVSSFHPHPFFH